VGKGVGQVVVPLPFDRSMHVTNFEFFPGGVKMDWVGIVPDIEVKLPADADLIDDPAADTQLSAAKLELVNTASGNPSATASKAQVQVRRAQLEKEHRDEFQKEVQERQKVLAQAAEDAATRHQ
jgi:C-terminal processing protease CtpA/Prc